MAHARLGPSNHRWPHCPGSIREEAVYPYETNPAAIDGTGSHLLLEMMVRVILEKGDYTLRSELYLGQTIGAGDKDKPEGWLVEQDRCDRVNQALAYIERRSTEINITSISVESQSSPGYYVCNRDDWWGTVDLTLIGTTHTGKKIIEVIDYKDGQLYVSEIDNPQLIGYGAGKLGVYIQNPENLKCNPLNDPHEIRMTIIQPKCNPSIRYQDIHSLELWQKAKELGEAAAATDDPNAPLHYGEWCRWCKHGRAGNCVEQNRVAMEGVKAMTTIPTNSQQSFLEMVSSGQIATDSMDDVTIGNILDAAPLIEALLAQVEDEAFKRLKAETFTDGRYEIGNKRSSKKYTEDDESIAKKLKGMRVPVDLIWQKKLITPAKALELPDLTDKQLKRLSDKLIEVVPGGEKVVKASPKKLDKTDVSSMFGTIPTNAVDVTPEPAAPGLSFLGRA